MSKSYDLFSKSDMNKLVRDLKNDIKEQAKKDLLNDSYEIECEKCETKFMSKPGSVKCPNCGEDIDFILHVKELP